MTCEMCGGSGWIVRESAAGSSAKPCSCRKTTAPTMPFRDRGIPLTVESAATHVAMLCDTLAYAPSPPPKGVGRAAIVVALMEMCSTDDEAKWVVQRAMSLHTKWETCGIPGLRQIVSSIRIPKDGISLLSTDRYPEGVPPIKSLQAVLSFPKRLAPGASTTADGQLATGLDRAAQSMKLLEAPKEIERELTPEEREERRRALEFEQTLEELETPPEDRPRPITRKPIRQSQFVPLAADDPVHEPRPEGTYKPITAADINSIPREEIEKWKKSGGGQ